MQTLHHKVQFCVIGGGLAGMCAAISAARHGVRTLLMQDRPVFGGNASSEVRMWVCGAPGCLETGLIEELRLENLYRNTYSNYSVWDSILFEKVRFQENLTSLLNCTCQALSMQGNRILSVKGWQMTTQTYHEVEADYFADCSGDSILAPLSGAEYRVGREAKEEFGESLAQEQADRKTMGISCILQARQTDSPKKFIPPAWANRYPDDSSFPKRNHNLDQLQNFWWLEFGGDRDCIGDAEKVRDEMLKAAFGIWDHIKNHGDHGAENWELDWVGFLPGKRESRRMVGDYMLSQKDILSGGKFEDMIAYGGWAIDDHHPGGFHHYGEPNIHIWPEQPYGIPLRCLYSRNIANLLFAGRNISCTHTGLSSTRVMATCATLGQAIGTTVYHAIKNGNLSPRETGRCHIRDIQRTLQDDDCYLPGLTRNISPLCATAVLRTSSGNPEALRNGMDRNFKDRPFEENLWLCGIGDYAEYDFGDFKEITGVRLVFDSDLDRDFHNMVSNYWLKGANYRPPETLVTDFHLEADGKIIYEAHGNHQRLVKIPLAARLRRLRLVIDAIGSMARGVFAFEAE